MSMMKRRVVVSGMGVVSPFGNGTRKYNENIFAGNSGSRKIKNFDVSLLPTQFAANVPLTEADLDGLVVNKKALKTLSRAGKFAFIAAQEAVQQAQLKKGYNANRFGVSLGVGGLGLWDIAYTQRLLEVIKQSAELNSKTGSKEFWHNLYLNANPMESLAALPNIPAAHLAIQFQARGVCQSLTTACTSSAQAIGEAFQFIKQGRADVMLCGGSDSMVNPNALINFMALGVLSKNNDEYLTASRPFDRRRDGFMLGEGAAVFVMEEYEHSIKRGATPLAEINGYASTCEAYRLTDENPDGISIVEVMKQALANADIRSEQIDYINAHGTGTKMNDKIESLAIKKMFNEHAYKLAVSSVKSMIGHLVAAAGAIELSACILALQNQMLPPTINYLEPDPDCDLDYVPNKSRDSQIYYVMSNSLGFGGQNACLVLSLARS